MCFRGEAALEVVCGLGWATDAAGRKATPTSGRGVGRKKKVEKEGKRGKDISNREKVNVDHLF